MPTVATIEKLYVDSSALCQVYVHGAKSMAMSSWRFKNPGPLTLTRFGRAEISNAISLAAFRGELTKEGVAQAERLLAADMEEGYLRLVDLPWRAVFERATELSHQHTRTYGTRSLDVLHVASALELNARRLVTYDNRQARLAAACGLKVIQP